MQQQQNQPVSGLSLEAYLKLHKALTKQGNVVQPVTPIEECYYKLSDLRQLLQLHGITAGKFNRAELLAAIKGQKLISPCCTTNSNDQISNIQQGGALHVDHDATDLPFTAADVLAVLGMPTASAGDIQQVQFLQLGQCVAPTSPAAVTAAAMRAAAAAPAGPPPCAAAAPQGAGAASTAQQAHTRPLPGQGPPAEPQDHDQQQQHLQASTARQQVLVQQPTQPQATISGGMEMQVHRQQHVQQAQPPQQTQAQHPAAAALPASTVTSQGLSVDPLHQLLATLLHQTAAGPAAASLPLEPVSGPMLTAGPSSLTVEALQQLLLLRGAAATGGRNSSTGSQPAVGTAAPAAQGSRAAAAPASTSGQAAAGAAVQPAPQASAGSPGVTTNHQGQPGTAATEAPLVTAVSVQGPAHAPWLKAQLQWFAASGVRAAAEGAPGATEGSLLGHRVGFVLLEEMQVVGPRNTILTLPAGVYEGMAVKHLGSSCQYDVCDYGCAQRHDFYRARVLPPRALPDSLCGPGNSSDKDKDLAASLSQAHAAASGRPVLLILDLHPRLRSPTLEGLLVLASSEQLQDAWVLLEQQVEPSSPQAEQPIQPAAAQKRGNTAASSKPGHKRAKV